MGLTKEQILAAQDLKKTTIEVPEWGGTVNVKQIGVRERDELSALHGVWTKAKGNSRVFNDTKEGHEAFAEFRLKTVAFSLADDNGNRLFSDADIEDLGKKSPAVIDRVYEQLGNAFPKEN
jgi:hypothetical protein